MTNAHLRLVSPNTLNGTVVPRRPTNAELRTREYLTEPEVERLMKAAKYGRYAQRDATLILIAFRHGLRASEIAGLEWSQIEWGRNPTLHVRRAEKGTPAAQQDYFVVLTEDESPWKNYFNVSTDKEAYVVLIDASGRTLWRGHGPAANLEPQMKAALR